MAPFFKVYHDDERIQEDISILKANKIEKENIYVLSHDDDRTNRIAKNTEANTIGASEQGLTDVVKSVFEKQGDELRDKIESVGFSEAEASEYEAELDKGAVFLIVTETYGIDLYTIIG